MEIEVEKRFLKEIMTIKILGNRQEMKAMKDGMNVKEINMLILDKNPGGMIIMETIDMEEDLKNPEFHNYLSIMAKLKEKDMEDQEAIILLVLIINNQCIIEKKVVKLITISKINTDLPMGILLLIKKGTKDKILEKENEANHLDLQNIQNEVILQIESQVQMLIEGLHICNQGNLLLMNIILIGPMILTMEMVE